MIPLDVQMLAPAAFPFNLLHYHFMQSAYLAGTAVAISAGAIGYFVVLRSQSFAAHALANVGFAGATGAALFGFSAVLGLFLSGVAAAAGIQWLGKESRRSLGTDIAVGAVLTAALALGFVFVYSTGAEYAVNVYSVLFGNVLGISDSDVRVTLAMTAALGLVLIVIGRPLFFASVDPAVAAARGVWVTWLSLAFLVLLALAVAIAAQVVGVLLVFALLITPAAIARQLTARPAIAMALGILLATAFTWAGLAAGYLAPYPVGFFITSFAFATYAGVRAWVQVSAVRARRSLPARGATHR